MNLPRTYNDFLLSKRKVAEKHGFDLPTELLSLNHPLPHQPLVIQWTLKQGRALLGLQFGLTKTVIQCEVLKQIYLKEGDPFSNQKCMIVCPLGVKHQFIDVDGPRAGMKIEYCTTDEEIDAANTPFIITNYERVRDGDITIDERILAITLDEGSVLRNLGTQTTQKFIDACKAVKYRFVATATPAPNEYLEIINYAEFLGIMDRGQALTRWFKRDSLKAGNLTIHPQHEQEFWMWVRSWSLFLSKPSELGFSDEGYDLPGIEINWHCVPFDEGKLGITADDYGQIKAFADATAGIQILGKIKRASISEKISYAKDKLYNDQEHFLLWHLMEDERKAIEKAFRCDSVYGSQTIEEKEKRIMAFAEGKIKDLATKPEIAGSGCNFQYHCHRAIYLSIDYRFQDFIQSIYRIYRFRQGKKVIIDILFTPAEQPIVDALKKKWDQHNKLMAIQSEMIREFGLSHDAELKSSMRKLGLKRRQVSGENFTLINNDSVEEVQTKPSNSTGLQLTSIPFGNHYEYTALYNDFGHNENDDQFFRQMDFLIREKYRTLMPGRNCIVHVKDRILYGHQTGLSFPTVNPFSDKTIAAYQRHGFAFMGRITIMTDVVRENNQTYRLGWSEQCKDGSKMGVGSPEYLLIFRKPPSDLSNGYADVPVQKSKEQYTRGRWQLDAHSFWRSSGDRLLTPEEYSGLEPKRVYKQWQLENQEEPYNYERHVAICEALDNSDRLSASFMTMPPHSWDNDQVWTDINYMLGLNMEQSRRKQENHICPLPYDIVDRCILRWSNPGDEVADWFSGLGTTAFRAVHHGRKGFGCELNAEYFDCSAGYLKELEAKKNIPTLFDIL
jgi:DNA modification methylase